MMPRLFLSVELKLYEYIYGEKNASKGIHVNLKLK